ncbi:MAG: membrane associated rhomboid family serine protease [Candidatus Endobugula sp.]|jgi:membrane associated rhomboid family serine protease
MNSILADFKLAFKTGNILNQLIVINVIGFVVLGVTGVIFTLAGYGNIFAAITNYLMVPSDLSQVIFQPWSLITYFFYHQGVFHILFNMLFLYWFGKIIVEYLGQNKVLGLYVWGGIFGGLLYLLAYNVIPFYQGAVATSYLLGASGGVIAIVVGAATFMPNYTIPLILLGPVKLKYIAAFYVITSLLRSTGVNAGGEIAHLGGALAGWLFITQLKKGSDWSRVVVDFVIWMKSLFTPQPKIKVSYRKEKATASNSSKESSSAQGSASTKSSSSNASQAEIDSILDKISEKGYDALSKDEKQKLFNASKD